MGAVTSGEEQMLDCKMRPPFHQAVTLWVRRWRGASRRLLGFLGLLRKKRQ